MQRLDSNAPKTRTREKATHEVRTHQRPHRESESNSHLDSSKLLIWGLVLALLAALAAVFIFWKQAGQATQQSADLNTQFNEYKKTCEDRQKKDEALKDQFIAIRHWATKPVQMRGTPLSEDGYAVVYWNNVKKTAYLDVVKLPEPAAGKQYQLWAIVDGKPTDMGIFDLSTPDGSMKTVDFIENPQAFAVTLEPKGGSQSPTLDQMYVVGSVKG